MRIPFFHQARTKCGAGKSVGHRGKPLPRTVRPRFERLEDRVVLDAGDSLNSALLTGLGPAVGSYAMSSEFLGDGAFADKDVDMYAIRINAGQFLDARTSYPGTGTDMDTILELFDSHGNGLTLNDDSDGLYSHIAYSFAHSGTYYIAVSGYANFAYNPAVGGSGVSGSTGDYRLDLNLLAVTNDFAGDTMRTAQATRLGWADGSFSSSAHIGDGFYPSNDVDLYGISARLNQVLSVATSLPTGGQAMTPYVRVFNGDGNEVFSSYDYGSFQYQIPARGTYFIGVSGYGNTYYNPTVGGSGAVGQSIGDYLLNLTLATPVPDTAGDTIATALNTNLGTAPGTYTTTAKIGDGIYPNMDVDLYRVNVNAGQFLTAAMSLPSGGVPINYYPSLQLFDAAGNSLTINYGYENSAAAFNYQFAAGGAYYVGVSGYPYYNPNVGGSGYPGGTGDYRLNLTLATPVADAAGDTIATAQATNLGTSPGTFNATAKIGDGLFPLKDVDMYRVDMNAGQLLTAITSLPTGGIPINYYTTLRVFNATGGEVAGSYYNTNSQARVDFQPATAGSYYVGVSGYPYYDPNVGGSGYAGGFGDYQINLTLVTPVADSAGDTIATAQATGFGPSDGAFSVTARVGDGLYPLKDVDLYQISASSGQLLSAVVSLPSGGSPLYYTTLRLFNATGVELASYSYGYNYSARIDHQFATSGTFYLGVSSYPGYNPNIGGTASQGGTGDYRLNLALVTPTPDAAGDTIGTAKATGLGSAGGTYSTSTQLGDGLYPLKDVDIYQISADPGQVLSVGLALPVGGRQLYYTSLRLFNSAGVELSSYAYGYNYNGTIDYQFAAAGTYYVGVSAYPSYNPNLGGTAIAAGIGDYQVNLTLTTPTADAAPDSLSAVSATSLGTANGAFSVNGRIGDGLYPLRDVDLYRIDATAGQGLIAGTGPVVGGTAAYTTLRLFDATGQQLAADTFSNWPYAAFRYVFATSGTYYVGVSGSGNGFFNPTSPITSGTGLGSRGDYHLDLALVSPGLDSIGETISTALATGLGPTAGSYTMPSARIGDGFYSNLDVDMYSFSAVAGQRLTVAMPGIGGSPLTYGVMRLFDASGNQLTNGYTYGAIQNYTFTTSGTFYLGVSAYYNYYYNPTIPGSGNSASYTGDYRLTMNLVTPVADEADTIGLATATVLGLSAGTYGHTAYVGDGLYPQDDVDMYRVEVTAGQLLRVATSQPAGGSMVSPVLRIFTATGVELAERDNYYNANVSLEYQFTSGGTFYVGITGYYNRYYNPNVANSGYWYNSSGDYHVDMTLITPTPDAELETIATATATGLGIADGSYSHTGQIGDGLYFGKDVDMYRVDAVAGQIVTARTSTPSGGTPFSSYLRLFDANGVEISTGGDRLEYAVTNAGTYYFGISGYGNFSYDPTVGGSGTLPYWNSGDYQLDLTLTTPSPDVVGDTIVAALDTRLGPNAGKYTMSNTRIGDGLYLSRDVDMYKIRSQAGLVLTVNTTTPSGGTPANIIVTLFDATGNWVTQGYPNWDGTTQLQYTFASHGTYYIGISATDNWWYDPNMPGSGYFGDRGEYSLDVRIDKLVNAPTGGGGQHAQQVTGHVTWHHTVGLPSGGQSIDQVSINAWQDADGVAHGTMSWSGVYHGLPSGPHDQAVHWEMRVDTLSIVGNSAHVEGVVVRSGQNPGDIGSRVSWEIIDFGNRKDILNGELLDSGHFNIHS